MRALACIVVLASLSSGCWRAHEREVPIIHPPVPCDVTPPMCATRSSPCAALELVAPVCVDDAWQCPPGAAPYARPWSDDRCLPLEGRALTGLFADGVHEAPVPVPLGDRCAWVFPSTHDGVIDLAAIDVAPSCAELDPSDASTPIGDVEGMLSFVALDASFIDASGDARVLARGWQFDSAAPFGVRGLGVGLGTVRDERIHVNDSWLFDNDTDLGDAAIVADGFLFAYGCPGDPHWLEEDCIVGRAPLASIDDRSAWQILGEGGWGVGAPTRVFGAGPHRSAVVEDPRGSGFIHVYAIGFGRDLMITTAPHPEGPWSAAVSLAPCELPADDMGAYCAGPNVHVELLDPLDPTTIYVSYSVGTTSEDGPERRARNPEAYWPRVMRLRLP